MLDSYEHSTKPDISTQHLLPFLQFHFPNLQAEEIQFHYRGTYNVFIVKKNYILRVPNKELRNEHGLQLLENEKNALTFLIEYLQPKISLKFPDPIKLETQQSIPYMLYRKIPGISLDRQFPLLSKDQQIHLAHQIRNFLDLFHHPNLLAAYRRKYKINFNDVYTRYRQHWEHTYQMIHQKMAPVLNHEDFSWLSQLFEWFLSQSEFMTFQPTLVHGDFDTSNILIKPQTTQLTAIIDFEEMSIGDPAVDMLFFAEGSDFHQIIGESSTIHYDKTIEARKRFLYCQTCVPYLKWGLEHNKSAMIAYGQRRLKYLKKIFPNPTESKI